VTKKDIARSIADQLGLSQFQTKEILQKTLDAILKTLVEEGRVELRNFGVFEVRWRKARKGRNPRTGEPVMVPKRLTVGFKPGKALQKLVQLKSEHAAIARKPHQKP
jgi:nucleoid DNA-binding protein